MELLLTPGFVSDAGVLHFFGRRDQPMQFVAVEDIGRIVATVFAQPERFRGQTLEIAGDAATENGLASILGDGLDCPLRCEGFPQKALAAAMQNGHLAGRADLELIRQIDPVLTGLREWMARR